MLERLKAIWKDPVGSKLIATIITAIFLVAWRVFGRATFDAFCELLQHNVELPVWLPIVLPVVAVVIWDLLSKFKRGWQKKPLVTNVTDASARIASWWPKAKGHFPDDVHVNYAYLEEAYSLAPGLAKNAVATVAHQNYYKVKIAGDKHATFEYDHPRVHLR